MTGVSGLAGDVVFCTLCGHEVLIHEALSGGPDVLCPQCPGGTCLGLENRARFDAPRQPG